jgi:hypothetical protein
MQTLITLENTSAWAPGLTTETDWSAWAKNPKPLSGDEKIQATSIPPLLRRRCSHLGKMALEVAHHTLTDSPVDYIIFASGHGDLQCTVQLLDDICLSEPLSPTQFTRSVHNTSVGLFSIIHKLKHNTTFISAGDDTFVMAMLDALTYLNTHPNTRVLVVMAEATLPEAYADMNIAPTQDYAAGFLLSNHQHTLCATTGTSASNQHTFPPALEFLAWHLQHTRIAFALSGQHQALLWERAS